MFFVGKARPLALGHCGLDELENGPNGKLGVAWGLQFYWRADGHPIPLPHCPPPPSREGAGAVISKSHVVSGKISAPRRRPNCRFTICFATLRTKYDLTHHRGPM